jgi:hypothetical protein
LNGRKRHKLNTRSRKPLKYLLWIMTIAHKTADHLTQIHRRKATIAHVLSYYFMPTFLEQISQQCRRI